jgi:hypothetical protein
LSGKLIAGFSLFARIKDCRGERKATPNKAQIYRKIGYGEMRLRGENILRKYIAEGLGRISVEAGGRVRLSRDAAGY